MGELTGDHFDEEALRQIQLGVICGLAQYGNTLLHSIKHIITDNCFGNDRARFYYNVIKEIVEIGVEIDDIVFEEFAAFIGHGEYFKTHKTNILKGLATIRKKQIPEKNAIEYARILARREYKNSTVTKLRALADELEELPDNTASDETSNKLVDFVRESSPHEENDDMELLGHNVDEFIENTLTTSPSAVGVDIGMPLIEEYVGGILPGTVTALSARMKSTKSIHLLNFAINAAKKGLPVLFMDMEMQHGQIIGRALANLSQVELNDIKYKTVQNDPEKSRRLEEAGKQLKELPITWKKTGAMNVNQYVSYAQRWLAKKVGFNDDGTAKPCLVILDYIKMTGDQGKTSKKEFELLGEIASKIKDFANNNAVPVITALQLNRGANLVKGSTGNVAGSDRILMFIDAALEISRKTDIEIAQDNADFEGDCGNIRISQTVVRDSEVVDVNDYICIKVQGALMTCTEIARKSSFARHVKKPTNKPLPIIDEVPE